MRKKAQDKKKVMVVPQLSSSSSSISSSSSSGGRSFYDTGGANTTKPAEVDLSNKVYSMDEIWKDIELSEESSNFTSQPIRSPMWEFCPNDSLWSVDDEEESKLMMQNMGHSFNNSFPFY